MSSDGVTTTQQRPYLLRAMHEWMTDNGLTPHIVIDVSQADAALPTQFANDGRLIINVSYSATQALLMDNERVSFNARFSGVPHFIDVPVAAVLGIYARESGQGMIFSSEEVPEGSEANGDQPDDSGAEPAAADEDAQDQRPSGRPTLKVIK